MFILQKEYLINIEITIFFGVNVYLVHYIGMILWLCLKFKKTREVLDINKRFYKKLLEQK